MNSEPGSKKRLQVIFSDEAWKVIETLTQEANNGFEMGTITYSDVINEMALNSKVDLKALQAKRTDVRRSLRYLASQNNLDLDQAIRTLTELKAKAGKRPAKNVTHGGGAPNE